MNVCRRLPMFFVAKFAGFINTGGKTGVLNLDI
jgi:hypothetical protein